MFKIPGKLSTKQSGFTLIELVIVIVIIGILAAVAIPNFTTITDDAKSGVASGIGGSAASFAASNLAACKGNLSSCVEVTSCQTLVNNVSVPSGSTWTADGTITKGLPTQCTLTDSATPTAHTATFTGFGTSKPW